MSDKKPQTYYLFKFSNNKYNKSKKINNICSIIAPFLLLSFKSQHCLLHMYIWSVRIYNEGVKCKNKMKIMERILSNIHYHMNWQNHTCMMHRCVVNSRNTNKNSLFLRITNIDFLLFNIELIRLILKVICVNTEQSFVFIKY